MLLTLIDGLDRTRWDPLLLHHEGPGVDRLAQRARSLGIRSRVVPRPARRRERAALARLLREERGDVFHAHLAWPLRCTDGILAAARARVPAVVATQHLFSPISSRRRILRQRVVAGRVDRYVAVSDEVARGLRATPLFPRKKIEVIRNGIRFDAAAADERGAARARLTGDSRRRVVLTLARLDPQKGLSDLVRAAEFLPEAVFAVAGEGPERERLEAEARAAGVAGRFLLLGHREDTASLLAACDVFVLPSLYEGLPLAVLEAMAARRPVVATRVGGTDEAVRDEETGLLVPPQRPELLARAIGRLLDDADLASRLAASGADLVAREFSAARMVRETADLYERLLAPSRRAA